MRIAVSNLAWDPSAEDVAMAELFGRMEVGGVEVAPTKVWPAPLEAARGEILRYRRFWSDRGIEVVAMQALLFGQPQLALFGSGGDRDRLAAYLSGIIALGGALGAGALVFGSPGNRRRGPMEPERAMEVAAEFFRAMGAVAVEHGTTLCIEPNPEAYGCDFVTTVAEGTELVARVAHPGFRLHLDAGGMTLNAEAAAEVIPPAAALSRHFHVSEPNLAPIGEGGADHGAFAAALRAAGWNRWISIEMKPAASGPGAAHVERALRAARHSYAADPRG